ncbi:hypothetical protein V2G26_011988 [Clonostachys chloroleuca]
MASSSLQGSPPLPTEIWLLILDQAANLADLASFARVNGHFWNTAIPLLYGRAASSSPYTQQKALFWGLSTTYHGPLSRPLPPASTLTASGTVPAARPDSQVSVKF